MDVSIAVDEATTFTTVNALKQEMRVIGKVAAEKALEHLGVTDPAIKKEVAKVVEKYALNRSASLIGKRVLKDGSVVDNPSARYAITDKTRESIRALVKQAIDEGWSNDELALKLRESYAFSKERANLIARTETNIADNDISMNSYREAGVVKKSWLTAGDDKVEPECVANQAQGVIGIDDLFISGDVCPPCHPNCRCTVLAEF